MVHAFKCNGKYFALDVDTGALHQLDKLAYGVLLVYDQMSAEDIAERFSQFSAQEVKDAIAEIEALKAAGSLFSEVAYDEEAPLAPSPIIKAMCLHVAHDCNLRCKYCFASQGDFHGARSLMPLATGKRALEYLIEKSGSRRQLEVDFFGGEPMMNFEVVKKLVEYGRELEKQHDKVIRFTITTNAYGLTEDSIDFINREMKNVVLSLDGRESVHDAMRPTAMGKPSYARSLENAKKLVAGRGDKEYYVRGTFTRDNLDFSKDVLALADAGFTELSMEPVMLEADSPYSLRPEHLPQILNEYEELLKAYLERWKQGRGFGFFHFNVDLTGGPCMRKRLSGCGAGGEYVAVTPDGEIYPCHQFVGREGWKLGDVFTGRLDESIREKFAEANVTKKQKCRDCWAKYYCSGGCVANAHAANGSLLEPYDMECQMQRKRLECALAAVAEKMTQHAQ